MTENPTASRSTGVDKMRDHRNIGKHELIGLEVEIVRATDERLVGTTGTVVDETKNTLLVETEHDTRELRIQKKGTGFQVTLEDGNTVEIDGDSIMFRPEDRIKRVKR